MATKSASRQQRPTKALTKTRQPIVPTKPGAGNLDLAEYPEIAVLEHNFALLEYAFSKMEPGVDYGVEIGIKKPFLHIPGTERLQQMFNLILELEDTDYSEPSRDFYRHKVIAKAFRMDRQTGEQIYLGMGIGLASSRESKYRYRWMKAEELPSQMKAGMMTTYTFKDGGTKDTVDIQKWIDTYGVGSAKMTKFGSRYRVDNPEVADLDNTVAKQAAKRARADAVQNVTGAHRMFARAEDAENVGVDATVASRYEEQAADVGLPVDELGDSMGKTQAEPARKDTGNACLKHPGKEFKNYPTKVGGIVWAHKAGTGPDNKTIWCIKDDVKKEIATKGTSTGTTNRPGA